MSFLDVTDAKMPQGPTLPDGTYTASIDRCTVETTKTGSGKYLKVSWKIQAPEKFKGRLVFHNYNFENTSKQAEDIGRGEIKAFLQASGATTFAINSPTELCGTCCEIVVKTKSDDFGDRNTIVGYRSVAGQKGKSSTESSSSSIPGF